MSGGQIVFHRCRSTKMTSLCSDGGSLIGSPVATPQSAPSPLAGTSPHYSLHPARHTSSCAWLWPRLVLLDPGANSVIDVAFRSRVLVRGASCSLPVCRQAFLYLRGLALNFMCTMQRLPRFDTDYFVSRTSVADLPEGVAQFCARGLEGCPAVGELPGGRSQIIA